VRTLGILVSGLIALVLAAPAVRAAEAGAAPGGKVRVLTGSGAHSKEMWLTPGNGQRESFRDCPNCPEMVVVPAGEFVMGSPKDEPNRWAFSEKQQKIAFGRAFAAGKYAVTRGEFEAFVTATRRAMADKCEMPDGSMAAIPGGSWRSPGFKQTARHPVVCVTNGDADAYAAWLSQKTGKKYRLIVDSEREYAARAGTTSAFWWGDTITPDQANYDSQWPFEPGGPKGKPLAATLPVDAFKPNPWGLYQVHGNVAEWVEDCWNNVAMTAPADGSVRPEEGCTHLMHRGGGWRSGPAALRSAAVGLSAADAFSDVGFRVARDL